MFANQFSPPVLLHSYNAHTGAAKTWKFFLPLLVEHSAQLWPRRTFRICCHGYYLCTLFSLPYVYHPEYCEVMSCCIQQGHALKLYKEALKIVYRFVNVTCIANGCTFRWHTTTTTISLLKKYSEAKITSNIRRISEKKHILRLPSVPL